MDLLEQYKQQYPEKFREKKVPTMTDEYGRAYSGMVAFVIRISGGRIKDARQASVALLAVSAIIVVSALIISFWPSGAQNALPENFNKIDQSQYAVPK